MRWLVTQTLEALNLEHVQRLYADKSKVKAYITGFPVNVAVDLDPDVAQRVLRDTHARLCTGVAPPQVGIDILPRRPLGPPPEVGQEREHERPRCGNRRVPHDFELVRGCSHRTSP